MTAITTPWRSPDTAPRDMTYIIGDFGMPWSMVACWSPALDKWCCAEPHVDMYEGEYTDPSYQNEYLPHSELRGWMPMPVVRRDK